MKGSVALHSGTVHPGGGNSGLSYPTRLTPDGKPFGWGSGYNPRMSEAIHFRTACLQWSVQFERRDHRTTAIVTSQPLAAAPRSASDNTPPQSFSVTESDQNTLIDKIRGAIEQRDGPVLTGDLDEDVD